MVSEKNNFKTFFRYGSIKLCSVVMTIQKKETLVRYYPMTIFMYSLSAVMFLVSDNTYLITFL